MMAMVVMLQDFGALGATGKGIYSPNIIESCQQQTRSVPEMQAIICETSLRLATTFLDADHFDEHGPTS